MYSVITDNLPLRLGCLRFEFGEAKSFNIFDQDASDIKILEKLLGNVSITGWQMYACQELWYHLFLKVLEALVGSHLS